MDLQSRKSSLSSLILAAIGVVYGDIGTSPLYTMKEVFSAEHGLPLNPENVLGVVSLIFWALAIIVSLKYVTLVLRADNRGEGGIMALVALALSSVTTRSRWYAPLVLVGLVGASLFFGDGVITPAISVLSAIEGLEVATPAFKPYVVPLTVAVLVGLYALQSRGTADIGKWFGPILLTWFLALAAMGVVNIVESPRVLAALNPLHAFRFLGQNGWLAFIALGAVVLAVTGVEALYADMGHFGRTAIRSAWFGIVFPSLVLNYFGQGALLLANPAAVTNPFYQQLGSWSVYPLVALSTVATVIASQATISGAFSVSQQAIALGFLPRMKVVYTSEREKGQIYIPLVNWMQMTVVILAVVGFGSSSKLASAYGIAATATMLMTTILTFFVIRYGWHYNPLLCWAATGFFLTIDLTLFSANILKVLHGGWFPLALGAVSVTLMLTWRDGRQLVYDNLKKHLVPMGDFLQSLFLSPPVRVEGTAVFFRAEGDGVPHAMLHNLVHNKVLHERTVFLTVFNADIPFIPPQERIKVRSLGHQCYQLDVHYGFKDDRDIPAALVQCKDAGLEFDTMSTSYFISRQTVIPRVGTGMAFWRESLFAMMSRNARDAADYFRIPTNRVIELGNQVEI
ncbi:MAG TPA: potassium transporter Kup [Noviherbaspirillum sp.]|uniref:potassium transporter Kup n=1 Tax=Noviherbaspirillum sp. TaxID=1926288 RepID=UPI002B4747B6|nr:potassium transporter Kup [Noviherbaspirillum sp.]HJV87937.1 potassium transporter Kup [Noviherbaspirillum sp.]